MIPQPPPGQGPIDPQGAFSPPPPPPPGRGPVVMPQMPPPPPPGMYPMMPPMMYPAPPPRRTERSFARAIFMPLATSIFGLSLLANVYLLVFSGLFGSDSSYTT